MPLPRLRRPRPRSADDNDWGTSSPAAIMQPPTPPVPPPTQPDLTHIQLQNDTRIARLRQQELKTYTTTFSPRSVISLYFAIAFLFIPIGSAIIAGTSQIRSTDRALYSEERGCEFIDNSTNGGKCVVEISIKETITAPSYLYYSISNMFQNYRDYAKSRSDIMNRGLLPRAAIDVSNCEPLLYENSSQTPAPSLQENIQSFIYPCGLTAWSHFNDTFRLCRDRQCTDPVPMEKEGIAWETDVNFKFQPGDDPLFEMPSDLLRATPNELLQDEDFIVWMRLSAFSNFDKLHRIIREDLSGTYFMHIESNYNTFRFKGAKSFYITNTKWFGAGNTFLGTIYIIVGIISLGIASTLLAKHVLHPRPPASSDPAIVLRELAKFNMEFRSSQVQPS